VDYRQYRGGDERDIVQCWNRSLLRDPITLSRFLETTILDENFDEKGLFEAYAGGSLVGFVHAVTSSSSQSGGEGWVCAIAVDPANQRQGIGSHLLGLAETYLVDKGCDVVAVSPYPENYYFPGVPVDRYQGSAQFFGSAGYRVRANVVAMDRCLADYEYPAEVLASRQRLEHSGWRFHPISTPWYLNYIRLCEAFSADWGKVARRALRAGCASTQIQLATRGDDLGGFAMFGAFDSHPDRFGPFGVDPTFRTQGLGGVLLHQVMQEMAAAAQHDCWFLWTGEQEAAGRLYRSAGFDITRRFTIYERQLKTGLAT